MKYDKDVMLMNFIMSVKLHDEFQYCCKQLRCSMTSELNRMIRKFVEESKKELKTIEETAYTSPLDLYSDDNSEYPDSFF
jgi:hypothetical protein